jgi:antitoxin (DNA-binding transcriptional repressor) of toxin-antitoxin stability system
VRFVTIRDLRSRSAQILKDLGKADAVITSGGTPVALLTAVTPESLDLMLRAQRQARAVLAMVELQTRSASQGADRMDDQQVLSEIAAARRERPITE